MRLRDEERRRLVRDLHDGTGQALTALLMNLAVLGQKLRGADAETSRALEKILALGKGVVQDIRTQSVLLHPPVLDELGLGPALRWYAEEVEKRSELKVELQVSPAVGRYAQETETALFRIAQESLTNVIRHSGSAAATMRLTEEGDAIRLTIADRGRGFSQAAMDGGEGAGVRGMRERARDLGGRLSVRAAAPGTVVEAVLPRTARPG